MQLEDGNAIETWIVRLSSTILPTSADWSAPEAEIGTAREQDADASNEVSEHRALLDHEVASRASTAVLKRRHVAVSCMSCLRPAGVRR